MLIMSNSRPKEKCIWGDDSDSDSESNTPVEASHTLASSIQCTLNQSLHDTDELKSSLQLLFEQGRSSKSKELEVSAIEIMMDNLLQHLQHPEPIIEEEEIRLNAEAIAEYKALKESTDSFLKEQDKRLAEQDEKILEADQLIAELQAFDDLKILLDETYKKPAQQEEQAQIAEEKIKTEVKRPQQKQIEAEKQHSNKITNSIAFSLSGSSFRHFSTPRNARLPTTLSTAKKPFGI